MLLLGRLLWAWLLDKKIKTKCKAVACLYFEVHTVLRKMAALLTPKQRVFQPTGLQALETPKGVAMLHVVKTPSLVRYWALKDTVPIAFVR